MQNILLLVLAHLLADFTFQSDGILDWKRRNAVGGIIHSGIFFLCAVVLCFPSLHMVWVQPLPGVPINGWMALIVLSAMHFFVDAWRSWTIKALHSPDSFFFFLLDQFLHLVLIVTMAPQDMSFSVQPWVLLGILFVLVTHFASVFIFFMEKDIFGRSDVMKTGRYYHMIQRLLVAGALLLPGLAWPLAGIAAVWAAQLIRFRLRRPDRYSLLNVLAGNILALGLGLLARDVLRMLLPS